MAEVRMTIEEYENLVRGQMNAHASSTKKQNPAPANKTLKPKRNGRKDPKMAKALKEANRRGRTKAGKLRKGYTQGRIMKMAHKLRRSM